MSQKYGSYYSEAYYLNGCGNDYNDRENWTQQFGRIAQRIVELYNPKNFLDVGCAFGYLVEALRNLGVEAYGVDVSEYAISRVREDIRPYCYVCNAVEGLPEGLPDRFDCVSTIEVIEHLYEEDAQPFIRMLCSHSDQIIFSSTPDDFKEPSHFNVQQQEYWAKWFAQEGFVHDLNTDLSFLSPQAMAFKKSEMSMPRLVENYEKAMRQEKKEWERKCTERTASFYFSAENQNFSSENIITAIWNIDKVFEEEIKFPVPVDAVRFDPVEGHGCAVWNLYAMADGKQIDPSQMTAVNGKQDEGIMTFCNEDPQVLITFGERKIESLRIQANICEFTFAQDYVWKQAEKKISELTAELRREKRNSEKAKRERNTANEQFEKLAEKYEEQGRQLNDLSNELGQVRLHESQLQVAHDAISHALFWRITWPMRWAVSAAKKVLRTLPGVGALYELLACLKDNGLEKTREYYAHKKETKRKTKMLRSLFPGKLILPETFVDMDLLLKQVQAPQKDPKISVVVPLYNTPQNFLEQMVDSVRNQTYQNWELCLADGSDENCGWVGDYLRTLAKEDKRILYKKLEKNGGISENTNEALKLATGDYISLFDHDDLLHPCALWYVAESAKNGADFIYTDELTFDTEISNVTVWHFKPDFAIDNLRSNNYICHLTTFKRELYEQVGGFRHEYDGSQDYDMVLRLVEKAKRIEHIPHILYYWRTHAASVASDISAKPYCITAGTKALQAHLQRCGLQGKVSPIYKTPGFYKIDYELQAQPLVSIIIPNKDQVDVLRRCISSIQKKSTYKNYEIIVVENNSEDEETFDYYKELESQSVQVVCYSEYFNYSRINNWAEKKAHGEMLLFLNNDVEVINPNWLQEMLMYIQREDVGIVGAKLYYPNNTVQHAGIGIGLLTLAGHYHKHFDRGSPGYMGRLLYAQDVSAVTAACMMVKRSVFEQVDGFDESFEVAFNDVDFCLKVRKKGYLIVMNPFVELYHYESISRGDDDLPEKRNRFVSEVERFQQKWQSVLLDGDPYYNSNLSLDSEDFRIAVQPLE